MNKNRKITINGVCFQEKRLTPKTKCGYNTYDSFSYDSITEAYKYPSYYKQKIGSEWEDGAAQPASGIKELRAMRRNNFYFSIGGVLDYAGHRYFIYITAMRNYIVQIY